jgi:bacterioferritin
MQHAADELRHADMVSNRIIQLGGTPPTTPKKWFDYTNCGYDAPDNPFVQKILEQNIKGEQCAISVYNSVIEQVGLKDPVTYNIALQILEDEVEHEEDLQALLEDLTVLIKK